MQSKNAHQRQKDQMQQEKENNQIQNIPKSKGERKSQLTKVFSQQSRIRQVSHVELPLPRYDKIDGNENLLPDT